MIRLLLAALGHAARPLDEAFMSAGAFQVLPRELGVGLDQVTEEQGVLRRQGRRRRAQRHEVRLRRVDRLP